jgi:type 1 glutamine amidotransferase
MRKLLGWTTLTGALLLGLLATFPQTASGGDKEGKKIRVVIIDGQNNHDWRSTTPFMKKALEDTGRFTVDVATAPEMPRRPQPPKNKTEENLARYKEQLEKYEKAMTEYRAKMAEFRPAFETYQVVLSNYNGDSWPKETSNHLEALLKEGKIGLVIVHAANNSFGGWKEYNRMIGMGWRDKNYGPRLKVDEGGQQVIVPKGEDQGSGHQYTGPFSVVVRDSSHPVTKGMPREWMHTRDELYDNMRGPIESVHLLATAYSKGTKTNEPMIWTVTYGNGRVFHTPMGHDLTGMRCVGFVTTLARGTEWAATGAVTLPIPANFPTDKKASPIASK